MQKVMLQNDRQGGVIEVTPQMIEAGVAELKDHSYGGDLRDLVSSIYMAMEFERRDSSDK